MSQTANGSASALPGAEHDRGAAPANSLDRAVDFFEDAIWNNRHVCSNCFAQLQRRFHGTFQKRDGSTVEIDHVWRTDDATLGETHEDPPDSVASVQPLARPRTTCTNCGSVGGAKQKNNLGADEARDRVPALVARLEDQGYQVSEHHADVAVARLKSIDRYTGYDKQIFAVAAALALKHG